MLIEREEACLFVSARRQIAGPDGYPTDPALQKWAHEAGSAYMCDQKVRACLCGLPALLQAVARKQITYLRLSHVVHGAAPMQSYVPLRFPGKFSEELLENTQRGFSAQGYTETVIDSTQACPPPGRRARNEVRSDEEGGVRQPWEPLRTFQRTY